MGLGACPSCQKVVRFISGIKCPECGHVAGSQAPAHSWDSRQFDSALGRKRSPGADDQQRAHRPAGDTRRNPLKFDE
jgi:hypothetical protein